MAWVALCGPELEENLSLRYLAAALKASGIEVHVLAASQPEDFPAVLARILRAPEPPLAVGLSLAFQWRAPDFVALAVALREEGYGGHITAGGHFATFAAAELLRDFPALDSICRQEAEETLVALARALGRVFRRARFSCRCRSRYGRHTARTDEHDAIWSVGWKSV